MNITTSLSRKEFLRSHHLSPCTASSCPATLQCGPFQSIKYLDSARFRYGSLFSMWDQGFVWFPCVLPYSTPSPQCLCCALGETRGKKSASSLRTTRDLLPFLPPTRRRGTRGPTIVVFPRAGGCFLLPCPLRLRLVRAPSSTFPPSSRIAPSCWCELWSGFLAPPGLLQWCLHRRVVRRRRVLPASFHSAAASGQSLFLYRGRLCTAIAYFGLSQLC